MIIKTDVIQFLKEYKQKHQSKYHLAKIGLFGSVAREENSENSDIDIVVEFVKPNLFIQAQIQEDLKEKFNAPVDVIALSKYTNPKLLKRIQQDVVYV